MNTLVQTVAGKKRLAPQPSGFSKFGLVLFWNLAGVVLLGLTLPVALLFATTGVPLILALVLWLADILLLYVLPRLERSFRNVTVVVACILALSLLAIAASQYFASTPQILDEIGERLPGSVASLEKVNLNGSEEWITIRGKNANNPVLLYLGMGVPGSSGLATRSYTGELEEYFVVVSWDKPGSGKSYDAVPAQALTRERFVQDGYALTQLLRERFHQDKIYLYGSAWSSVLGIWMVQEYPQLFHAFIGSSQLVKPVENDCKVYERALEFAADCGDTAAVQALKRNGAPPYLGSGSVFKYLTFSDVVDDYRGEPRYGTALAMMPMFMPEYGLLDKVNHLRGLYGSFETVYPQLQDVDLATQAARLDVPVYFIVGREDVYNNTLLVENYFNRLEAPHKELIRFEATEHAMDSESIEQVVQVLVNQVLPAHEP